MSGNMGKICSSITVLQSIFYLNTFYKYHRGSGAENDFFLQKANTIVHRQFGDFSDFKASWLVKVTWKNVKFYGDLSKVRVLRVL